MVSNGDVQLRDARRYVGRAQRKLAAGEEAGAVLLWLESEGLDPEAARKVMRLATQSRKGGGGIGSILMLVAGAALGGMGLLGLLGTANTGDLGHEGSVVAVVMMTAGVVLSFLGFKRRIAAAGR